MRSRTLAGQEAGEMFELKTRPLIPRAAFMARLGLYVGIAFGIVCGSLAIGVLGYRLLEGFSWIDSLLNASMLLGGMGPVNQLHTNGGKLFASLYALYSGIVFLVTAGFVIAPLLHRFLHHFHLESDK
jgi:hypothetical protein